MHKATHDDKKGDGGTDRGVRKGSVYSQYRQQAEANKPNKIL